MTFFAAAFRNSIFFSYGVWNFTRQGFYRHQKSNSASAPVSTDLTGKNIVITGGSSGLGLELTKECLKSGARVWVLCRDTEKARKSLVEQNGGNLFLVACDLSRPKDIQEFAQRFLGENPNISVDVLVNNAGVLLNQREFTQDGLEKTFATNIMGIYCLTKLLKPSFTPNTRVVNVTSGGLYTQPFDADIHQFLQSTSTSSSSGSAGSFDGAAAYAQTKRQLLQLTHWFRRTGLDCVAVHPGWALTPGVESSLPEFTKLIQSMNGWRTVQEGIHGILWLVRKGDTSTVSDAKNACFYLDCEVVPEHLTGTFTYINPAKELQMEESWVNALDTTLNAILEK